MSDCPPDCFVNYYQPEQQLLNKIYRKPLNLTAHRIRLISSFRKVPHHSGVGKNLNPSFGCSYKIIANTELSGRNRQGNLLKIQYSAKKVSQAPYFTNLKVNESVRVQGQLAYSGSQYAKGWLFTKRSGVEFKLRPVNTNLRSLKVNIGPSKPTSSPCKSNTGRMSPVTSQKHPINYVFFSLYFFHSLSEPSYAVLCDFMSYLH